MIGNLWFRMFARHRRPVTSQCHRIRPILETLEDRITPSTVMENAADAAQLQTELNNATAANTQYVINLTGPNSAYTLASGQQLTVSSRGSSISIVGTGQSLTGNGNRVFDVLSGANLILQNLTITGGSGVAEGAGLYDTGGNVTLSNVNVMGNTALGSSSAANAQGGGIYVSGSGASLTLDNVRISGNKAVGGTGAAGGAMKTQGGTGGVAQGGGIYVSGGATVDISAAAVSGNIAHGGNGGNGGHGQNAGGRGDGGTAYGGGAYLSLSATATSTILNSSFTGNIAQGGNGGNGATFTTPNGVHGGTGSSGGGGGGGAGTGGGLFLDSGSVQILNTTVADNQSNSGGAGIAIGTAAVATLMNNTIYHNDASVDLISGGGVFSSATANPTLVNNLLLDNLQGDTNLTLAAGDDNLTTADTQGQAILGPQQTTANGLVYYPLLPSGSAAIDQGNNSALATIAAAEGVAPGQASDEIGGARLVNGVIDIGAIEFPPTSTGGGNPSGGNTNPPSIWDAAFTIALDAAELVLEINGFTSVGPFVFQPPMTLLHQILANLPYAGTLDSMALQVGAGAGQQFVNAQHDGSNH